MRSARCSPITCSATSRSPERRLLVTTVVSADLLGRMAAAAGAGFAETLTGFKWIMRAADAEPGRRFRFGYEEALGYAVTDLVRDKDGMSAAVALADAAAEAGHEGGSLATRLDDLARRFGLFATGQFSALPGRAVRTRAWRCWRRRGPSRPSGCSASRSPSSTIWGWACAPGRTAPRTPSRCPGPM